MPDLLWQGWRQGPLTEVILFFVAQVRWPGESNEASLALKPASFFVSSVIFLLQFSNSWSFETCLETVSLRSCAKTGTLQGTTFLFPAGPLSDLFYISFAGGSKTGPSTSWTRCLLGVPVFRPPKHLLQLRGPHHLHRNQICTMKSLNFVTAFRTLHQSDLSLCSLMRRAETLATPETECLLYATYWFRPILSELIGAATESATVNRDQAPSGPVKVVVTNQPHSRPNAGIDLASGVSALLAWFPASWACKVAPCFIGDAGGATQPPQEVTIQCPIPGIRQTHSEMRVTKSFKQLSSLTGKSMVCT